jgi:hypothetical protein
MLKLRQRQRKYKQVVAVKVFIAIRLVVKQDTTSIHIKKIQQK